MIKSQNGDEPTPAKQQKVRPTIGLLIRNVADWEYQLSWLGVVDIAREYDVNLICFPGGALRSPYGFEAQANVLYDLVNVERLDGLLIRSSNLGLFLDPDEMVEFGKRYQTVPVVTSASAIKGQRIRDLMLHLIGVHGARRMVFVRGPEGHAEAQRRYQSYLDTLAEFGLPFDATLVVAPDRGWVDRAEIQRFLDRRVLPDQLDFDAVIGANDQRALIILEELQARGVHIPNDVAVVGVDDRPESRVSMPPLTTHKTSLYEQKRKFAEVLLAKMRGEPVPERIDVSLAERVVVRRSCGCVPITVTCAAMDSAALAWEGEGESFEAMVMRRRLTIVTEIVEAVEATAAVLASDGAEQVLEAFVCEILGDSPGAFVPALERVLYQIMAAGDDVLMWQQAISVMRCHLLPWLPDRTTVVRAENLWAQARVLITEMGQQALLKQQLEYDRRTATLREISGTLATTFDVAALMEILARELPRLEIPGCYVSLYEDPAAPAEWSRVILAYNEEGRVELQADGRRFPSCRLVPDGILPQDRQYSLLVEPLYFRNEQIGFVLFEIGPREGSIYEVLSRQISSALKGALLVRQVEDHAASLEHEVKVRTADLKTINTQLQQQIQERKQMDEALRLNESRLNSLFELSQQAHQLSEKEIVQFGLEEAVRLTESTIGYFHFVNQDQETIELYTWSHATLQACTAAPEKHYPISQAGVWADCARMGKPVVHNDYAHLPDKHGLPEGHSPLMRHMSVPVIDDGKIRVITGVGNKARDYNDADMRQLQLLANDVWKIVQQKRVEAERETLITELEAKNAELERFTYTVSHDLKSPLVTMSGFLGFLEQDAVKGDSERLRTDVQHIREATNTMQRLLNDLLELSRIGRLMNPPQELPFGDLAQEALERVAGQLTGRSVQVTVAPELPTVYGDRLRLLEVLQNLLENAIRFLGDQPEPQVAIGAKTGEDGPVLYVADNGIGIEPKYQEKVFGLFERLDPSVEGTGVGLAIVKRIIEVHGGQIWVESEGPGCGSTFYFTLPQQ